MRPDLRRTAGLLLLAASLVPSAACTWGREPDRGAAASAPARMSGPEAGRAIMRARELLDSRRAGGADGATRLADAIIANCDAPRYVAEGFLLKAEAARALGDHKTAAEAARLGVQKILTAPDGRPGPAMLTALKMLLAAYVESSVVGNGREDVLATLAAWKGELNSLYEADNSAVGGEIEAVEETFVRLAEMAEQYLASRAPEVAAQEVVRRYVRLFNTLESEGLVRMFAPGSAQAILLAESGAAALATGPVDQLSLGSAVKVTLSEGEPAPAAVATCVLIAVSPAGWARPVPGVSFSLERADDGSWLINEIDGHP